MYKKKLLFCAVLLTLAVAVFATGGKESGGATDSKASGAFDWKRFNGSTITVYMVEHSTSTAIQSKIRDFEAMTGIKV
ncbi:MAG: hypothetical protein LBF75_07880, partial [Treponema sp.]|nr:hypothetical protein [Treponema sp.]